ncbi:hypothetical protein EG327_002899 [Venturia inaequalis]|uniref:Uncharacterized protein n=2 Tax=Venturia inaequalis TaxID=5025 RepID=A0A8H3VJ00_VENIN|nr:hypothetical protein EG327_002899 [Venturia inaequalis]
MGMMLFGMFSCLGRKKKKTSNMTPNHDRRHPQPERRPNNTKSKSPLVNLPPELRQRILFFLVSDEQLLYSVPLAIEFCHQDKTYTGPPKRQKRIFLNFTYMTMRELIFPDMSDVHSVFAEDMEWVKKGWVARARNLYTADEVQREFASKYVDFRACIRLLNVRPVEKAIGGPSLLRLGRRCRVKGHYITFSYVGDTQKYTLQAFCGADWWQRDREPASFQQVQTIAHNFCIDQKRGEVIPHVYGKFDWKPEFMFSWGNPPPGRKRRWIEGCRHFLGTLVWRR